MFSVLCSSAHVCFGFIFQVPQRIILGAMFHSINSHSIDEKTLVKLLKAGTSSLTLLSLGKYSVITSLNIVI